MYTGHPRALENLKHAIQTKDKRYLSNVKVLTQVGTLKVGIFKNNLPIAIFENHREWAEWKHSAYLEAKEVNNG